MTIAVVNQSSSVSDADVARMVVAVDTQLYWQAARAWSRTPLRIRFAGRQQVTTGEWQIVILDTPDQLGVLGWHTEDAGQPHGAVFAGPILDHGGDACTTPLSVSSVLSHEALETMFDWTINLWADDGAGRMWSYEVCDPCEGDSYKIGTGGVDTTVSNFVLPTFFDVQTKGRVDWVGTCPGPFQLAHHGYAMTVGMNGQVSQIRGDLYDPARARLFG